MTTRAFAVSLTIPDNEAFTALGALRRLGVDVDRLDRSTIWSFVVDDERAVELDDVVRHIETIYNPNKHRLVSLEHSGPREGEVWVAPLHDPPDRERVLLAGRVLPGVHNVLRRTAWRLLDTSGTPARKEVVNAAVERLLCNPASERTVPV